MCAEQGWNESIGYLLSPEILYSCGHLDNAPAAQKADGLHCSEGNSLKCVIGKYLRHHRGLRTWHVLTGVARELGRSDVVLAQKVPVIRCAGKRNAPGSRWLFC